MSEPPIPPRAHWRMSARTFVNWPRLFISAGAGLAVSLIGPLVEPGLRMTAWAIAGWDVFCISFLSLVFLTLLDAEPQEIRARSAQLDEGGGIILALVLGACVASIAAVALELTAAHGGDNLVKAGRVTVALLTVAASWLVTQTMFALHYAHEYYAADPVTRGDVRGLAFPGDHSPDYWDFVHFSFVIGVASQTADIAFTDQRMRRLGTVHSLIAFAFNTLIVALTINLVAGLF